MPCDDPQVYIRVGLRINDILCGGSIKKSSGILPPLAKAGPYEDGVFRRLRRREIFRALRKIISSPYHNTDLVSLDKPDNLYGDGTVNKVV